MTGFLPRPGTLAWRLLAAQVGLITAMAATMVVVGLVVGPGVFHGHMMQAGHGGGGPVVAHAEEAFAQATAISLLTGTVIGALGALGLSVLVSRRVGATLRSLSRGAEQVAAGRYDVTIPTDALGTELDGLAAGFARMADQLADTERTRRRLLTDVAHELRTPISIVAVTVDALEDGVVSADDPATIQTLREQLARLTRLAGDLRAVSAVEEGQAALRLTSEPVADLLHAVDDAHAGAYAAKGVTLAVDVAGARAAGRVRVDRERVGQLLTNLLTNALRHTPVGGVVAVSAERADGVVRLTVRDTGDGIAAAHLPHVFERFYRTDTARDRDHGGTGVGLAISAAIAHAHGGSIVADSAGLGRGAVFTVELPAD